MTAPLPACCKQAPAEAPGESRPAHSRLAPSLPLQDLAGTSLLLPRPQSAAGKPAPAARDAAAVATPPLFTLHAAYLI